MASEERIDWSECPLVEIKPGVQSGAPVLRGTRMPVSAIVDDFDYGQFPALSPDWRTPLRDTIPWATLRSNNPFSAGSVANLRIADILRLMEAEAKPADSRMLRASAEDQARKSSKAFS